MVAYYQEEAGRLKRCIIILQNHNACENKYRKENDSIHEKYSKCYIQIYKNIPILPSHFPSTISCSSLQWHSYEPFVFSQICSHGRSAHSSTSEK